MVYDLINANKEPDRCHRYQKPECDSAKRNHIKRVVYADVHAERLQHDKPREQSECDEHSYTNEMLH